MEFNKKRKRDKKERFKNINLKLNKKNKINDNIINLPGYYLDKEKNRYFPINNDYFQNYDNKKNTINFNKNINKKIHNGYKNNLSNFFIYKNYKLFNNKEIKNLNFFTNSFIKNFEIIEIDKFNNISSLIYKNKYFISMSKDSLNYIYLLIYKVNDNSYIKKIFFYNFIFDNFYIIKNNLFLISNIKTIYIINNFEEILYKNNDIIKYSFINNIFFNFYNINNLLMMYDWPIIINDDEKNNFFFFLVKNCLIFFKCNFIDNNQIKNSETIIFKKENLNNSYFNIINKKYFNKSEIFINIFIKNNFIFLFNKNGKIYKINKFNFKIYQIIECIQNSLPFIEYKKFKKSYLFLINSERDIYLFDYLNNNFILIYKSSNSNNLIFKKNLLYYNKKGYLFFLNENNKISFYNLIKFSIIKEIPLTLNSNNFSIFYNKYLNKYLITK